MPSKILKPNLYVHLSTKWSQEDHGEVPPCGICRKSCFPTQWWQVFAFWICSKSRLLEFIISESKISWNVTQKVPGAQPEWWNANRVRFFSVWKQDKWFPWPNGSKCSGIRQPSHPNLHHKSCVWKSDIRQKPLNPDNLSMMSFGISRIPNAFTSPFYLRPGPQFQTSGGPHL